MDKRFLAKFGTLCAAYEGDLSLLDGTLVHQFACADAVPDFTVRLRRGKLTAAPGNGVCVYENVQTQVWDMGSGVWHRRYASQYAGVRREYASLTYDDKCAELVVAPICENTARCVESCTAFEHLAIRAGALPLHASQIRTHAGAILFAGPSGIGKSTQAALWEQYGNAEIINGDKTLLLQTKEKIFAAGIPYCGTSNICKNDCQLLCAIVILSQAKENSVLRLDGAYAASQILSFTIRNAWHPEDARRTLDFAAAVIERVPVYLLRCLPEESAVRCLRNALAGGKENKW